MTTSYVESTKRVPLRLRLSKDTKGLIDGAWWPQSRDLPSELADLIDNFPEAVGRIDHVVYSGPDWDLPRLRRVQAGRGPVKVGTFPRDDTNLAMLVMASSKVLQILVVPSNMSRDQAVGSMSAATSAGNQATAKSILRTAPDWEGEAAEHWTDDGGAFWDPNPNPPSAGVRG
jgi:hypothetical protein